MLAAAAKIINTPGPKTKPSMAKTVAGLLEEACSLDVTRVQP